VAEGLFARGVEGLAKGKASGSGKRIFVRRTNCSESWGSKAHLMYTRVGMEWADWNCFRFRVSESDAHRVCRVAHRVSRDAVPFPKSRAVTGSWEALVL
jgi:hypothetical protein